jgi:uncharacterized protein YjiK
MRTAIYITAFILVSVLLALTIRTSEGVKHSAIRVKSTIQSGFFAGRDKDQKSNEARVLQKWEMPAELEEISGITYLDASSFACVQDEVGKIFIYNTTSRSIEKEIPFGDNGDYEGLAIVNETAYVLRSDGVIIAVKNYLSASPSIIQYKTQLNADQDTEGLCYDKKNERLLIAIKGSDSNRRGTKSLYAFDLKKRQFQEEPVVSIDLSSKMLNADSKKKKGKLKPSEVGVHPKNGNIYITDGARPKLVILDQNGKVKAVKKLDGSDFNQPEGIAFSPQGELFISNEAGKEPANILKVELN